MVPYSMPDLSGGMHGSRWQFFWKTVASALEIRIAMVDPRGRLLFLHSPFDHIAGHHKKLLHMIDFYDFFSRVPLVYAAPGVEQAIPDPWGVHWIPARLDDGFFLLLGGCPEGQKPQHFTGIPEDSMIMEDRERGKQFSRSVFDNPEIMEDYLIRISDLHASMNRYCKNPGLPQILPAVENVNRLIALTFEPGRFDLNAILELVASFLAALAEGGGAFAFSYEYPGRIVTSWHGRRSDELQILADDWKIIGRVEEPAKVFDDLVREKVKKEFKTTFEGFYCRCNGASLYLGLIGTESGRFQKALAALAEKAEIALKISSLSTIFKYGWGMVFNSIRQGVIVTDNRGLILLANPAAKGFFSGGGKAVPAAGQAITAGGFGCQIEEAVYIAARNNCSFMQKRLTVGEDDSPIHLHWDVMPLQREDGCSAGAVIIFEDITEQVRIYHDIHDWERLTTAGEIAAGLAHEVRNPLATAKAAIQLARIVRDRAKQEELLVKMERELDRMNEILTNFLDISKPRQEKTQELVDLNQSLRDLSSLLNSEALLGEVDLEITLCTGKPVVLGFTNNIKQVFLNLARNAFEAMGEGGKLSISTSLGEGQVHIAFQDNGPGIPAENMAVLTKPYFSTKRGGTGLGLSITASIVEIMGGDLKIASNPGRGTTVNLVLPLFNGEALHIPQTSGIR